MWLGTIAHSFLPSHIAAKHTRPKAQLRRAHGLRPADTDARVAPMPWQLRPAAPPGASSGVRRRPDRRGRSPGCSSDPPPNAPKSQNAAQGSRPAGAPASPPRPASRVPPPPRCPPAIRRRSDRRSRSLGCSAAANARVCARAWTGNSRQVAACSVGWCGAGAATGIGGGLQDTYPPRYLARARAGYRHRSQISRLGARAPRRVNHKTTTDRRMPRGDHGQDSRPPTCCDGCAGEARPWSRTGSKRPSGHAAPGDRTRAAKNCDARSAPRISTGAARPVDAPARYKTLPSPHGPRQVCRRCSAHRAEHLPVGLQVQDKRPTNHSIERCLDW